VAVTVNPEPAFNGLAEYGSVEIFPSLKPPAPPPPELSLSPLPPPATTKYETESPPPAGLPNCETAKQPSPVKV
jgi:hypothetical protein